MVALTTILAGVGVAAAVAGAGISFYGASQQQRATQQAQVANQVNIGAQLQALDLQTAHALARTSAELGILDLNRQQTDIQNQTQMDVYDAQGDIASYQRAQVAAQQGLSTTQRQANRELYGLSVQNRGLVQESFETGQEMLTARMRQARNTELQAHTQIRRTNVQERMAQLETQRVQRQAIRQGIAARAAGVAGATNRGASKGTQAGALASTASTTAREAVAGAGQNLQGQRQGFNLTRDYYFLQGENAEREQDYVAGQMRQADLANQSTQLNNRADDIRFGVNQAQFDTTDQIYYNQGNIHQVQEQIGQTYLSAFQQNQVLADQGYAIQGGLLETNAQLTQDMAAVQETSIRAGANVAAAQYSAASAASLTGIGSGLASLGGMFLNNAQTIGSVGSTVTNYFRTA